MSFSNKRVVVIGSTGQLGSDIVKALRESGNYEVVPLGHTDIEVTDQNNVVSVLSGHRPDAVINCAAFLQVDACEQQPEKAFKINAIGALNVAKACASLNSTCVYISTDYVFNGEKDGPYIEDDCPQPINVYGVSKLAGEHLVRLVALPYLIVRVSSLYGVVGPRGKSGNFIDTILAKAKAGEKLKVVDDIIMSPTYTYEAAKAIETLLRCEAVGVFHTNNSGKCTWYEFARKALELTRVDVDVERASGNTFPSIARRPRNTALSNTYLQKRCSCNIPSWEEALENYLQEKGYV